MSNYKLYNKDGLQMFQGAKLTSMSEGNFGMLCFRDDEGIGYLVNRDVISAIIETLIEEVDTNE